MKKTIFILRLLLGLICLSITPVAAAAPIATLDKWGGAVGTEVTVTCRGFSPGKVITFTFISTQGIQILGSQAADDNGNCAAKITIPPSPQGQNTIGVSNDDGQKVSLKFTVIPEVNIEPGRATPGEMANVKGSGYTPGDTISVFINELPVSSTQVGADGSFTATFMLPLLPTGINLVEVRDHTGKTRWREITITPKLTLNMDEGEVGAKLTLKGSGFNAEASVQVKFDSIEMSMTTTDALGQFNATFNVPTTEAGHHVITIRDGEHTQQLAFTVESEPPVTPEIVTPKLRQSIPQPVALDWGSVFDLSEPVTYDIQIAHESDFSQTVLSKTGLTQSQYQLTEAEALLPNRRGDVYYWRVRAVDAAGNRGEWSEATAFRVNPADALPAWAKYGLMGIQAAIVIVFGIVLMRILNTKTPVGS